MTAHYSTPVTIDRERDEGRYADPNVWMHHALP